MSVTEVLQALGSWELEMSEKTPDHVISQLGFFGHVAIVDGPVDVEAAGNSILAGARYVGVCRDTGNLGTHTRGGAGLVFWLGDEDGKGHTILTEVSLTNATLADVVAALKPPTVTTGVVHPQADPAARWTGTHFLESRREALARALSVFGAEIRVNGDFSIDVGTPAQLYNTEAPDRIIKRRAVGSDVDLVAVGGDFDSTGSAKDYSTDITVVGQTIGTGDEPDSTFVLASAAAASVPYKDPQLNQLKITRLVSASSETQASAPVTAALNVNRFARTTTALKVTADDFEVHGTHRVGDAVYVYDPDTGVVDETREVFFRGEVLHPDVVRVSAHTWPILEGMTVAWRTDAGAWIDLTPWVVWETAGSHELTVGDLPKTLTSASNPLADRVDAARGLPSTKTPKAPTGLSLTTASGLNSAGGDSSVITATWTAVTQYVDNTAVALSRYEVEYRPQFRAPSWFPSSVTAETTKDLPVTAALAYDVRVRAVSTGGVASAWSATASIVSAADAVAPPAPADPVLTQSLGQIRVRYPGTNNVGAAMPTDANRVDVEVSSAGAAGPFVAESSLNPFVEGIHRVGGTPGQTRWVRLRAYDRNGNGSAYSATVSSTIPQVQDGEIAALSVGKLTAGIMSADVTVSGRFATALTGARVEMNALGFQKFAADNSLLVSITGTDALLTGRYKSALSGRRIEMGSAGSIGDLFFYSEDGQRGAVRSFTGAPSGNEAIRMEMPVAGDPHARVAAIQVESGDNAFLTADDIFVTYSRGTSTGGFIVRQRLDANPDSVQPGTYRNRLSITDSGLSIFDGTGTTRIQASATAVALRDSAGIVRFQATDNDYTRLVGPTTSLGVTLMEWNGTSRTDRYYFTALEHVFKWAGTGQRVVLNNDTADLKFSPLMGLINNANYGANLYYYDDGAGSNPRLAVGDAGRVTYLPVWAFSFVVSSSETTKADIRDAGAGTLDKVRAMRVVDFTRKLPSPGPASRSTDDDGDEPAARAAAVATRPGRREVGLIAEQVAAVAPELVVHGDTPMVDVMSTVSVVIGSVQEAAALITDLQARVAAIEKNGRAA